MSERKAVKYGEIKLIPGVVCDGYVWNDGSAVLSENGAAKLLGIDQKLLNRIRTNWPPKSLESFIDKGLTIRTNLVEVVAKTALIEVEKLLFTTASLSKI